MSFSLIEIDPVYHVYSGQFSSFPEEIAVHGLSCRRGGVSEAPWASLDLGLHVGDDPAAVIANRRNIMQKLGVQSVAALVICAVSMGYVDESDIRTPHK
mgnify:CR=1 FL=1